VEGRGLAKRNSGGGDRRRTQSRDRLQQALDRVRQSARRDKGQRFTALWHHVYNVDRLREAYRSLNREGAPGVDGATWEQYGRDLEERLGDLSERLRRGAYRAKPVRRVYIPKADGRQRPIGVPAVEDKIVQRATVEVLNAVYEQDSLGFSYGFRPGRGQHDALDALAVGLRTRKVNWVLDADIRGFFDTIDHGWLVKFVEHRVADRRVVRHVRKWLGAGVLEDGGWRRVEAGTPQGGNISPLLANLYLHYVFDLWVRWWRARRARGEVIVVRYADDFIVGFQHRHEAERFREELRGRLRRFGLELHPEKTRLIEFGRFAARDRERCGDRKPETFNFLGFTHICGSTREGKFKVLRRTMAKRMRAKLRELKDELRRRLHHSVRDVGRWLQSVLRGHYEYYGVPGNWHALSSFHAQVVWLWHRALRRRSQRDALTWDIMLRLVRRYLPYPRILHPYPEARLGVWLEARARCEKLARRDPCGGRPERAVPTATGESARGAPRGAPLSARVIRTLNEGKGCGHVRRLDFKPTIWAVGFVRSRRKQGSHRATFDQSRCSEHGGVLAWQQPGGDSWLGGTWILGAGS
jgi:group II intron reverse transcriptase/maturase